LRWCGSVASPALHPPAPDERLGHNPPRPLSSSLALAGRAEPARRTIPSPASNARMAFLDPNFLAFGYPRCRYAVARSLHRRLLRFTRSHRLITNRIKAVQRRPSLPGLFNRSPVSAAATQNSLS
jgi:hypothetical protein